MTAPNRLRWSLRTPEMPLPELPRPRRPTVPSVLAFSLAKAGSTMLFDLLARLCPHAGLVYVSLEDRFYAAGVDQRDQPLGASSLFHETGYCYGGFRGAPPYEVPILDRVRVVLLVRDPRDMLVSLYHSLAESHWIPETDEAQGPHFMHALRADARRRTVDEHALRSASTVLAQFERYEAFALPWRSNVALYRYEDVVYRKREWAEELCAWFEWSVPDAVRDAAVATVDVFPETPDPGAHVRQVHPGNHRAELAPATIRELDRVFARTLRRYGWVGAGAPAVDGTEDRR